MTIFKFFLLDVSVIFLGLFLVWRIQGGKDLSSLLQMSTKKNMIDYIFYLCVDILAWIAKITGTSYEFINILIFIIGYPLFALFLIIIIYWQNKKLKIYQKIKN